MGFSCATSEHQIWGEKLPSPHPAEPSLLTAGVAFYFARVWEPQVFHMNGDERALA